MAKLGSNKKPTRFRVQTEERLGELAAICEKNGWIFIGALEPDEPEDICELEYLLNPESYSSPPKMNGSNQITVRHEKPKIGRNAPCPCGSGRKYKKCCG